ncbi:MAG: hypothetical protein P9M14_09460 [Candidatus Alcyoniella australis]|nr:hypothetical protein [Candidatus Alcyoniella australis]
MRRTAQILAIGLLIALPLAVMAQDLTFGETDGEALIASTLKSLGAETDVDFKIVDGKYDIYCAWKSGTVTDEYEFLGMCIGASAELSKSLDKPCYKVIVTTQTGAKWEIEIQYAVQALLIEDNEQSGMFLLEHLQKIQ